MGLLIIVLATTGLGAWALSDFLKGIGYLFAAAFMAIWYLVTTISMPKFRRKCKARGVVVGNTLLPEGSVDEQGIPYL